MKSIVALAVIAVSVAVLGVAGLAADKSSTKSPAAYDVELDKKINQVWTDCEAIHAGMTRADLAKMFRRETGGVAVPESTALEFRKHQSFDYRPCNSIMIDVDFRPSGAKLERPTDVILKVSRPYIDCRPRS